MMGNIKNALFWFACGLVVLSASRIFGPEIETRLFPVYGKFEIVSMKALDEEHTEVVFKFEKLRNCEPRGAVWAEGELGQSFQVEVAPQTAPTPRPLGWQLSRPYVFTATPEGIRDNLTATIFSQCPFTPWRTSSTVYP